MRRLSQRESRLLALGILLALVALLWLLVAAPILSGFSARQDERQGLLLTYARNQRAIQSVSVFRRQADAQRSTAGRFAVLAPTPLLATDLLRERIGRTVTQSGGKLIAVEDMQAGAAPGWIKVRADMRLTLAQFTALARRLQSEEPYLSIDYTSISANEAAQTRRLSPMDIRLEISARHQPARAR
ncbi:MAG TPA: type II secretion system protein GspM [Caulobacteraceae bacterium]|jgi:general secretion pathway protein M